MNKLLFTIAILFAYTGIFAQRTTLPNTATQSPSNKNLNNLNGQVIQDRLVVNDSAWFNGVQNVFPNGNVGIGTTTPEAKLHVSMSDTTGVQLMHLENLADNAIINLHSHADSSAFLLLQTGNKSAFFALTGVTGEVVLTNGLAVNAIEIDTNNNVTIPDLAGSAQKLVTATADGTLDTVAMINGFTIDVDNNMYAGTGALSALTSGAQNYVTGIDAGNTITSGSNNVVIGYSAQVADTSDNCISIGILAQANDFQSIAIGMTSTANLAGVAIGDATNATGNEAIAIGSGASAANTNSVAIGSSANTTAANQLVFGNENADLNSIFFGEGVSSTTAGDVTINASGGVGTNNAGAILVLAGGKSTGNLTIGGYISLSTSDAGASGTTPQSLSEKVRITKGGDLVVLNAANGIVLKDAAGTPHYWRVTISTLGVLTTTDLGTSIP